jgi:hypothetical protein
VIPVAPASLAQVYLPIFGSQLLIDMVSNSGPSGPALNLRTTNEELLPGGSNVEQQLLQNCYNVTLLQLCSMTSLLHIY